MTSPTVKMACETFLLNIKKAMPANTYKSYRSDLLGEMGFALNIAPAAKPNSPITTITEEICAHFLQCLLDRGASRATRQRHASTVRQFVRFVADTYDVPFNTAKLDYKIRSRHLLDGVKSAPDYPADKIAKLLAFTERLSPKDNDLTTLRDIAFITTLAQTGLRVHEAVALRVGSIDAHFRATIIGKGGKQATISWGESSRRHLRAYLKARTALDASSGRLREMLPLFARHDQKHGKNKVKPITVKIGEKIVHNMTMLALGEHYDENITCHKLRHYFGSEVYRKTRDVHSAQKALRHSNSSTTMDIYVHRNDEETAEIVRSVFG